jgi:hypothetical protein
MDGLCKMVEMRGGFEALSDGLKDKILRYRPPFSESPLEYTLINT